MSLNELLKLKNRRNLKKGKAKEAKNSSSKRKFHSGIVKRNEYMFTAH